MKRLAERRKNQAPKMELYVWRRLHCLVPRTRPPPGCLGGEPAAAAAAGQVMRRGRCCKPGAGLLGSLAGLAAVL